MKLISRIRHIDYRVFRIFENLKALGTGKITARNVIVNVGMPRSGSTVVHIAVTNLLRTEGLVKYIDNSDEFVELRDSDYFKTHTYFREVAKMQKAGNIMVMMTVRDIRDVAVSLIQKGWGKDLNDLLNRFILDYIVNTALCYSDLDGVLIVRYEDFNGNHNGLLQKVCSFLNIYKDEKELLSIIKQLNPQVTQEQVPSEGYNKKFGLHPNHIADGVSGKYKDFFTKEENNILQNRFKKFLTRFGYEC